MRALLSNALVFGTAAFAIPSATRAADPFAPPVCLNPQTAQQSAPFAIVVTPFGGRTCVTGTEVTVTVCAPAGARLIEGHADAQGANVMVGERSESVAGDCYTAKARVYPADHRGADPNYTCSPAYGAYVAAITWCPAGDPPPP